MKKFVNVNFDSSSPFTSPSFKSYQFATDIEDLKAGDKVVVDTRNGLTIAQVEGYSEPNPALKDFKWVVQKIDTETHEKRLEKQRQLAAVKRKMESRRKQLEEVQIFALLAKEDPSMKELFEEYSSLATEV